MTDRLVHVHLERDSGTTLVGRLWSRVRKGKENATFEYSAAWLSETERFALEPSLSISEAPYHTAEGQALFGALGDSAPDRWGRELISRAERKRAEGEGQQPRTLFQIDFLLGVSDETRQGALRFALLEGGPFLREGTGVAPLVGLRSLLQASARFEDEKDREEDLNLLLAPGSSLGGARPKASVRDTTGDLFIAKFPSQKDTWDVIRWETVALKLASRAGITVPSWRFEVIGQKPVLLVQRFDRNGSRRIPFLSAMSLLGARDGEAHTYQEIADGLRQYGAAASTDLAQLWRRIVFNVLISNVDDHLRNHAFLYAGIEGWRLSPAFDMNPVPTDVRSRFLSTSIVEGDPTASVNLALEVAKDFAVSATSAKTTVAQVASAVRTWRAEASAIGLRRAAQDRMASAFEHPDLHLT